MYGELAYRALQDEASPDAVAGRIQGVAGLLCVLWVGALALSSGRSVGRVAIYGLVVAGACHGAISVALASAGYGGAYRLAGANVVLATMIGMSIAYSRQRMRRPRIGAIIDGLTNAQIGHLGAQAEFIADPSSDVRPYDVLLVAFSALLRPDWARLVSSAALSGCQIRSVGSYIEEQTGRVPLDFDEPDLLFKCAYSHAPYALAKRLIDIAAVLILAPIALLVLAVASLAILVSMGRPILFVQDRVGLHGKVFRIYKLRTMRVNDKSAPQIATARNDNRITPLGKLLRRCHIDELPQLWNILKGDMSLIGPRPEQPALVKEYSACISHYDLRHLVRPGISGWAQVRYAYASTVDETRKKLEYDLYYIQQFGPALDLHIAALTLAVLFNKEHVR